MKPKILILLSALALAFHPASAQDVRRLTLSEAVAQSLGASKTLRASQARIQTAAAGLREAKDRRLPDLTVQGSYLRLNQPTLDLKVPLGAGSAQGGGEGSTGTSTEINQAMFGIVNLSYPIYAGGRVNYGIESARYLEEAARLDAETDREGVIQNTIGAYGNLYKAGAAVRLVTENLRAARQRVTDFSNLEKNGLLARNDLLKAQLQVSNIELSLLEAENNLRLATLALNLLLGLPENTVLEADSTSFATLADAGSVAAWESSALQSRADASALALRGKAAGVAVKAARAEGLPSLAVTGGYVAAHVPDFLTLTNAVNVGLGLRYTPSVLWKGSAGVKSAKSRQIEVDAQRAGLEDAIRLQVAQAWESYLLSQRKIGVYQAAVQQAEENYRIVSNKYGVSLATATELLDADVAQLQARLNVTLAQADAVVAYYKLLQAAGALSEKFSPKS